MKYESSIWWQDRKFDLKQCWVSWVRNRAPLRVKCEVRCTKCVDLCPKLRVLMVELKLFYKKILFVITTYIFHNLFQTRTLIIQYSQFGTKMYTSGTSTLCILLGAGHDHGPKRPISDLKAISRTQLTLPNFSYLSLMCIS